jgi:hypothetical protein
MAFASPRLARVIRKATASDVKSRYQDAFEFHNALQSFSAPNWKAIQAGAIAESWKGWDWKVTLAGSATLPRWNVSRARLGTVNYRAYGGSYPSASLAYKAIEDLA